MLYLLEGGKDSHFIESIFFLFDAQFAHFNLHRDKETKLIQIIILKAKEAAWRTFLSA